MKLLLDTNVVVWWLLDRAQISRAAAAAMADRANAPHVSAASAFEIATRQRIGKLPLAEKAVRGLPGDLLEAGITLVPITFQQAILAARLPYPNRDPFDRLIIALAQSEDMPVVTRDRAFADFGVRVIW